jgi:RNA polymerase sigma factor (sigma-70 family)
MGHFANLGLVAKSGTPLPLHIQRALLDLLPKFKRRFSDLDDDAVVTNILEEAGRRVADHEQQHGPLERLHGYAWVTIKSVAFSQLRRSENKVVLGTVGSDESESVLGNIQAEIGSPADIEREVLVREALAQLSEDERKICIWKIAGFSSKEIASYCGSSPGAIDMLFYRARERLRAVLGTVRAKASPAQVKHGPKADATSLSRVWFRRIKKADDQE